VQAIFEDEDVPAQEQAFIDANAEFFGSAVTGWGTPGGADAKHVSRLDVPLVRDFPARAG
jgi:ferredoxin